MAFHKIHFYIYKYFNLELNFEGFLIITVALEDLNFSMLQLNNNDNSAIL